VKFVGSGREYASIIEELGIADMIEFVDFVPHHVALGHVLGADVLLLVPGVGKGTMSGKIFEYIVARKPVLAIADECAAAELVRRSGIGIVVPPRDLHEIADCSAAFFDDIRSGRYVYPDVTALLDAYDRKSIARRCADVMGAAAANGR
jgi:glycosyltransferase involved in cell wall biosynthesis